MTTKRNEKRAKNNMWEKIGVVASLAIFSHIGIKKCENKKNSMQKMDGWEKKWERTMKKSNCIVRLMWGKIKMMIELWYICCVFGLLRSFSSTKLKNILYYKTYHYLLSAICYLQSKNKNSEAHTQIDTLRRKQKERKNIDSKCKKNKEKTILPKFIPSKIENFGKYSAVEFVSTLCLALLGTAWHKTKKTVILCICKHGAVVIYPISRKACIYLSADIVYNWLFSHILNLLLFLVLLNSIYSNGCNKELL